MEKLIHEFLLSRKLMYCSKKTISNYRDVLRLFQKFSNGKEISMGLINEWNISLQNEGLSRNTIRSYLVHIKAFVRWAASQGYMEDFSSAILLPKQKKKEIHIYSEDEIYQILDAVGGESEWIRLRNRALIILMLDSGLRESEPGTMLRDNVDFKRGVAIVTGKGDKDRMVSLGDVSIEFIKKYLKACPYDGKWLFYNRHGKQMTANSIKMFVQKMKKKLPFEFGCHRLRHNFATNFCIDGMENDGKIDIYSLKSLLGHESIETTEKYLHHATSLIASNMRKSHVDKLMRGIRVSRNSDESE